MSVSAKEEVYEKVTVFGHPMIFTCLRIDPKTVPEGFFKYSVRHDDDCQGIPVEVCNWVMVNHWGDLISNAPIHLVDYGYPSGNLMRDIEEDDFNYEGDTVTLEEYMKEHPAGNYPEV